MLAPAGNEPANVWRRKASTDPLSQRERWQNRCKDRTYVNAVLAESKIRKSANTCPPVSTKCEYTVPSYNTAPPTVQFLVSQESDRHVT